MDETQINPLEYVASWLNEHLGLKNPPISLLMQLSFVLQAGKAVIIIQKEGKFWISSMEGSFSLDNPA